MSSILSYRSTPSTIQKGRQAVIIPAFNNLRNFHARKIAHSTYQVSRKVALAAQQVEAGASSLAEAATAPGYEDTSFRVRKGVDDGTVIVPAVDWLAEREGEKPLGVYALYNASKQMQYAGYTSNMVLAIRNHMAGSGVDQCAYVRAMVFGNRSMATKELMEEQVLAWLETELSKQWIPPGNGSEREAWEKAARGDGQVPDSVAQELLVKANELRRTLADKIPVGDEDSRLRRLSAVMTMDGDDWSDGSGESRDILGAGTPEWASSGGGEISGADVAGSPAGPATTVSPFARARVHRAVGNSGDGGRKVLSKEAADQTLNEVRPFLMDDGGDVEVVDVDDGKIYLRLQGACSSCGSAEATMKMGIERALKAAFGDALKEVVQVDKVDVVSATVPNVDMHLNMLRGAVHGFGGSVQVLEVSGGKCTLKYQGPPAIGKGLSAAVRDRFPEITEVVFV